LCLCVFDFLSRFFFLPPFPASDLRPRERETQEEEEEGGEGEGEEGEEEEEEEEGEEEEEEEEEGGGRERGREEGSTHSWKTDLAGHQPPPPSLRRSRRPWARLQGGREGGAWGWGGGGGKAA